MFGTISTALIAVLAAPAMASLTTTDTHRLSFEMTMLDDVSTLNEVAILSNSIPTVDSTAPRCEIVDERKAPTLKVRPASTTERVDSCGSGSFIRLSAPVLVVSSL